jgi:hypothetical protein
MVNLGLGLGLGLGLRQLESFPQDMLHQERNQPFARSFAV